MVVASSASTRHILGCFDKREQGDRKGRPCGAVRVLLRTLAVHFQYENVQVAPGKVLLNANV